LNKDNNKPMLNQVKALDALNSFNARAAAAIFVLSNKKK
jgi:hypothetical protein